MCMYQVSGFLPEINVFAFAKREHNYKMLPQASIKP